MVIIVIRVVSSETSSHPLTMTSVHMRLGDSIRAHGNLILRLHGIDAYLYRIDDRSATLLGRKSSAHRRTHCNPVGSDWFVTDNANTFKIHRLAVALPIAYTCVLNTDVNAHKGEPTFIRVVRQEPNAFDKNNCPANEVGMLRMYALYTESRTVGIHHVANNAEYLEVSGKNGCVYRDRATGDIVLYRFGMPDIRMNIDKLLTKRVDMTGLSSADALMAAAASAASDSAVSASATERDSMSTTCMPRVNVHKDGIHARFITIDGYYGVIMISEDTAKSVPAWDNMIVSFIIAAETIDSCIVHDSLSMIMYNGAGIDVSMDVLRAANKHRALHALPGFNFHELPIQRRIAVATHNAFVVIRV